MTKVRIDPGACGMPATVEVTEKDTNTFSVKVTSECAMVLKLGDEIAELGKADAFRRLLDNPVYRKASHCLKHVACPVPSGILKAIEVEAGVNVPRDAGILFLREEA